MSDNARSLAIFIDFENLALGFQGRREKFDMTRVLERLVEKGKIVAKKAYADWSRFSSYTFMLHEHAIELVEIPQRRQSGKNSADIRLCVDAMDLAYSKDHIDTFVIVSGDSDFSPLVSKLKELGKDVIGLGMTESTSDLLRDNCDEFIYYEDLGRPQEIGSQLDDRFPELKRKVFGLLMDALVALRRENQGSIGSSMIKDTIKRKRPSFNETYHGYRSFSELLLDAQKEGLVELDIDKKSRTYVVTRFGGEITEAPPVVETAEGAEATAEANAGEELPILGRRKSRRRRRGRGNGNGNGHGPEREPVSGEPGRIRMSVPLPSGPAAQPQPTPPAPAEEDENDLDVLEESDPRLSRIDELDEDERADFREEREAAPVEVRQPAPQPQKPAATGQKPPHRPNVQPPQQGHRPTQPPRQPQPQPANRPAPKPAPQPARREPTPTPRPTPRVVIPGELPPPSDDEIFFSRDEEPRRTEKPQPTPQPAPRPRTQPQPVPTPRPSAKEPVQKKRTEKEASDDEPGSAPAETPTAEVTEPAEAVEKPQPARKKPAAKKPAASRSRASGKSTSGSSRSRKKPAGPAASEPATE